MAEPWDEGNPVLLRKDDSDEEERSGYDSFNSDEQSRGRQRRITVRCRMPSCDHHHTTSTSSVCALSESRDRHICCICSNSAYTVNHGDPSEVLVAEYAESSSSRSSSNERKTEMINKALTDTPDFKAFTSALKTLGGDDVEGIPPLERDAYEMDKEKYAELLAKNSDPIVKRVVSILERDDYRDQLKEISRIGGPETNSYRNY